MATRQRAAWAKLHALRTEFNQRIKDLKDHILSSGEPGTVDPKFLHGIDLVREEFEEYKFKQLAMACFFESSFKRFDPRSGNSSVKIIPRPSAVDDLLQQPSSSSSSIASLQTLAASPAPEENSLEAMLRQQRIMSGAFDEPEDDQDDADVRAGALASNSEDSMGSLEEELLAAVSSHPEGSKSGPTARDYEFVRNNLPTLSDLSAVDEKQVNQETTRLYDEGFFDLLHRAGAISDADFSITGNQYEVTGPIGLDQVYDEEMIFKRNSHSRMSNYTRMSSSSSATAPLKTSTEVPTSAEMKPSIKYSPPKSSNRTDDLKYARSIRRTELLGMINKFLSNFGISPVQRRDPLWKDWFLCEYLQLTPEDRSSGHPLVVLDKRDSSSFVEAVRRIYNQCCVPVSHGKRQRASPEPQEVSGQDQSVTEPELEERRNKLRGLDQETCSAPACSTSSSPSKPSQPSMMFPNSGTVFVLKPLFTASLSPEQVIESN